MGAFDKGEGGVGGSPPVAISGMPTHAPQSTGIFGRLLTHYIFLYYFYNFYFISYNASLLF